MLNRGYILDDKYEVVKTLGQGGMSTVYLCKNTRLGNFWAIKEVKKELKGQIDFLAEPNILKNLSHSGIPRVVDIFYREDNLYIVEDYIEGETLQDYINKNSFIDSKEISQITLSICDIIEYLHSCNPPIIYRDLKPSNIMITPKGKVVLIDFGISRVYKQGGDKDTIYMGSKGYAAPEQYGRGQTCTQTDIYGIGAVMYFMTMRKAPTALLEPLKDKSYSSEVNIELKKIIQKAVQIDIESRYSSVNEMKEELRRFLEKEYYTKTLLMNQENNVGSNSDKGTINFYRLDSNIDKTEMKDNTVKINDEKVINEKSQKSQNKFKIPYMKLKSNEDKSKKSFKRKLVSILVFTGIILGLLYLVTDHGKTEQIINSDQIVNSKNEDKSVSDMSKSENKGDTNSLDNKEVIKPSTKSTENKPNTENTSVNESANDKEISNTSDDKLQNKRESKAKNNGKAKGKHKDEDN
jgi:Serine/threonine protein kinase